MKLFFVFITGAAIGAFLHKAHQTGEDFLAGELPDRFLWPDEDAKQNAVDAALRIIHENNRKVE